MKHSDVIFTEVQRFRQIWLWMLMLVICVPMIVLMAHGMVRQLIFGEIWGHRPMPDPILLAVGAAMILLLLGILYIFLAGKLIVEVRSSEIWIHFYPLSKRSVPFKDIQQCRVRRYRPIVEFGGWGIRYGGRGKMAYNVSGDQGVEITLSGDKTLLIGSQKAEALADAIERGIAGRD